MSDLALLLGAGLVAASFGFFAQKALRYTHFKFIKLKRSREFRKKIRKYRYWIPAVILGLLSFPIVTYLFNFSSHPISSSAAEWGQMGDFFGGMLNPILAFASFIALLYTIRIQSEELRLTRLEFEKSVEAQKDIATAQSDSVKLQSESAELNRLTAEFEHLSAMFRECSKRAHYLLSEYTQSVSVIRRHDSIQTEVRLGLWSFYMRCLNQASPVEADDKKSFSELESLFKEKFENNVFVDFNGTTLNIDFAAVRLNLESLKREAHLVGKIIAKIQSNTSFSDSAQLLILEAQRIFVIVHLYYGIKEYCGYVYDPKPHLNGVNVNY